MSMWDDVSLQLCSCGMLLPSEAEGREHLKKKIPRFGGVEFVILSLLVGLNLRWRIMGKGQSTGHGAAYTNSHGPNYGLRWVLHLLMCKVLYHIHLL